MTRPIFAIGLAAIVMLASSCVQSPAAPAVSPTDIAATVEAAVAATVAALPQNPTQNPTGGSAASSPDNAPKPPAAIIATPIVQATATETATEVGIGPIITGTELAVTPVTATAVVTNTASPTIPPTPDTPIVTSLPPSETVPITATVTVSATLLPTPTGVVTGTVVPYQTTVPTTTVVPTSTAILTTTVTPTTTVVPTDTVVPTGTVSPTTTVPPTTPEPTTPAPTSQPTATIGPTAVPTTTPTPGPSPTPSPMPATIFIGSHHSYSEGSSLYVVGEAINGSSAPVYDVTIIATFHDGNGNLVGASEATTFLPQTVPTQPNPFKLQLPNAPANVSSYDLTLRWNEINVATFDRATIISEELLTENGVEIIGELRNDHRNALRNLVVVATFYDASGTVLDVVRGQANVASLPPGETATFNIQTRQSIPYASYLVQIEGMLLP